MNAFFIFSAQYLYLLPIAILGVYFLRQPRYTWKQMLTFALPALILTYLVGVASSYLYYDPRPFVVGHFTPLIPHASDNGFPSDHTLLVSALAMVGIFWNKKLGITLWIIAIIVAIARVYVGVHHSSDVIGSMIIAIAVVLVTSILYKLIYPR